MGISKEKGNVKERNKSDALGGDYSEVVMLFFDKEYGVCVINKPQPEEEEGVRTTAVGI